MVASGEVLQAIATGLTNTEIAEQICVSYATVKTHISRLLTKLDARDRAQLVIFLRARPHRTDPVTEFCTSMLQRSAIPAVSSIEGQDHVISRRIPSAISQSDQSDQSALGREHRQPSSPGSRTPRITSRRRSPSTARSNVAVGRP